MTFGERVRQRREELGLSQDELARKLGYRSRSTINKIELGKNDIGQSKIIAFAKALETTIDYLLGDSDNCREYSEIEMLYNKLNPMEQSEVKGIIKGMLRSRANAPVRDMAAYDIDDMPEQDLMNNFGEPTKTSDW